MSADARPGILFLEALPTLAGGQTVLLNLLPALRDALSAGRAAAGRRAAGDRAARRRRDLFLCPIGRYSLMRKSLRDVAAYAAAPRCWPGAQRRLIRSWGADLVYANSGPTFVWGALAAQFTERPIVWHHHNLLADGKTLRLVQTAARIPAVRRIICVSAAAQAQFPSVAAKTVVICNGVDTLKFQPDAAARNADTRRTWHSSRCRGHRHGGRSDSP
jgi:glycosyltransferase involved in cell wall biosynthesis